MPKTTKSKEWNPPKQNSSKREKMPAHCFLMPSEKKYPYKKKINGKWVISQSGLRAAISCANRAGHKAIAAKASKLYQKYFGNR